MFARGKVPRRMVMVEEQIEIDRPAADVFAYMSDQTHGPLWQRELLEVRRTTDGPIGSAPGTQACEGLSVADWN